MPVVRVVIVTYNSADAIGTCLTSLQEDIVSDLAEVVVVDNGSTDSTLQIVRSFDWAHLIQSEFNIGFGAGNNVGATGAVCDYLLFLNPDTTVNQGAISSLVKYLAETTDAGVVGPAIENEAGVVTLSSFRFLTPCISICIAFGLQRLIPLNRINGRSEIRRHAPEETCRVDRILGAAIAMPRRSFQEIGGFDEDYFLYSEEEDLCKRIRARGKEVFYYPQVKVTHLGGHSSIPDSPIAIASSVWSRQHFIRKHYGKLGEMTSRIAWMANLSIKYVATLLMPRFKHVRSGYKLALRSLISPVYYVNNVRPLRHTPLKAK